MNSIRTLLLVSTLIASVESVSHSEDAAKVLAELSSDVLPGESSTWQAMVRTDLKQRMSAVNQASRLATVDLKSLEQWQQFSQGKLKALRASLGEWSDPPKNMRVEVTSTHTGDGYRVENVLFESRPGWWITANLYAPLKPSKSMPGILLCHSHHRPKEQGELQDMGMTWARAGCVVLVPNHLGHGERRQHPFVSSSDYDGEFRVSRQDYYFRYDTGMQLHLVGESLIGWMAWDLMRGVDLLLSRDDVDPDRIILLGAVAGGGDPAAVAAALDPRIDCVVPFNFGGPQPETRYPLPEDAETSFNYSGSGGWESTRNLRRSAADGFLPYVIVGSIAPRRLIFAHEFNWHRERDPVWKRLQRIYKLHGAANHLSFTNGRGELRGRPPEATHCTNIGPFHRRRIHESLRRWFDIDVKPDDEFSDRRETSQLLCWTNQARDELQPKQLIDLLPELSEQRLQRAREHRSKLPPTKQVEQLRNDLNRVLGEVRPNAAPKVVSHDRRDARPEAKSIASVDQVVLETEPGISVPLNLLRPTNDDARAQHVVIAVAQAGKSGFLQHRTQALEDLLGAGFTVCLLDLRGTGETRPDNGRGRYSTDTGRSSTELMLGGTTVATRLRDLRSVMQFLRENELTKAAAFTMWGDSFAAVNPRDRNFQVPRRIDGRPRQSEPLGGLLSLLAAVYEDDVCAVYINGGLSSFRSVLKHQQVFLPHDIIVPGLLTVADLDDLAAAVAPRPLLISNMVDHLNRRETKKETTHAFSHAIEAYREYDAETQLRIVSGTKPVQLDEWLRSAVEKTRP